MYSKKIVFLLTFAVLGIILVGNVSAYDWTVTGGRNPKTGVVIESVEFNIPDGYVKNNSKSVVNETGTSGNLTFVLNQETYEKYDGEKIIISVIDYDDFDVDAQNLHEICEGADKKTINGYPGYVIDNNATVKFTYSFDYKCVSINASNEDLINQILVIGDA